MFCGKHGCFCVPVRRFSACSSGIGYGLRRSRRAQGALRAFFLLGAQQGRMHPFQPRIPLDAKKAAGRVHQVFQNPRRNLVFFRKNPKRRSVFSKQQSGGLPVSPNFSSESFSRSTGIALCSCVFRVFRGILNKMAHFGRSFRLRQAQEAPSLFRRERFRRFFKTNGGIFFHGTAN